MEIFLTYLVYVLGIISAIFIFVGAYVKVERVRIRKQLIKELIEKDYEIKNIDLNNFLK